MGIAHLFFYLIKQPSIVISNLVIKTAELPQEMLAIQSIRQAVFQAEQGVEPELDFDGKDETSEQIIAYLDSKAIGNDE